MSVEGPSDTTGPFTDSPADPSLPRCASYLGCRHCEEGSLVYDEDVGASVCRACGRRD